MGLASKLAATQGAAPAQQGHYQAPLPPPQQFQSNQQQNIYGRAPLAPPSPSGKPPYPTQGQYGAPQGHYGGPPQGNYGSNPQHQYGAPPPPPQNVAPPPYQQYQQYQQQPQQYGAPNIRGQYNAAAAAAPHPPQPNQQGHQGQYLQLLQAAVRENGLEPFYPPQRLQQLASTIGPQVQQISQQWKIPMELAVDLVRLSLYDIVIFCDDSGSMSFEENGERIDDLKLILQRTSFAASLFDTNGIEIRFMNGQQMGNNIRNEQQVGQLMSQTKFHGLTPLGTSLRNKVIDPMVIGPARSGQLPKPVLVITITDGHPAGESSSTIFKVIKEAKNQLRNTRYGPGGVAFQFAQVGNDLKAREFLSKLDTDREVGAMVDCTSNFEVEQDEMARLGVELTPSTWIVKLLMGAVDRSYDSQDEQQRR